MADEGHDRFQQDRLCCERGFVLVCQQVVGGYAVEVARLAGTVEHHLALFPQLLDQPAVRFFKTKETALAKSLTAPPLVNFPGGVVFVGVDTPRALAHVFLPFS